MTTLIPKYSQVTTANRTMAEKFAEIYSVKDFGAVGDGIADDTVAINATIAAVKAIGFGGEVFFPKGKYRITSTIESFDLAGVIFNGDMGTVNAFPTIADGINDSCIIWDGANSTDPMFYFERGQNNTFTNLCFKGKNGSDGINAAYACVWIDQNHENYRFSDCKFMLCSIGIRVCSSYDYATSTWNAGLDRYTGFSSPAAAAVGGFASDNGSYVNCTFGQCTIAGISIESAQALLMYSEKCLFINCDYGFSLPACQSITIQSPTFLIMGTAGIVTQFKSSIGNFIVNNSHIESGAFILFEVINGSGDIGKGITFNSCGGGDINIRGTAGAVTINNSILRTVSMKSAGVSLIINNSTLTSLDKTASLGNGPILKLVNVNVVTTLSPHWTAYDTTIIEKTSLPGYTAFNTVGSRISGLNNAPALMLGTVLSGSTVEGMEGVSFSAAANSLFIGYGCYQNSVGTIIATNTDGGYIIFNASGSTLKKFTGAVLGTTPVVSAGAYA